MSSLSAEIRLRPTRIGFLVDPDDSAAVRLCMNLCSCLWGGVYNPIIPVCTQVPEAWAVGLHRELAPEALAKGYIRFFEPDVFVEASPGLAERLGIKDTELDFRQQRIVPVSAMLDATDRRSWPPVGLNVLHLYRSLYDKEFKFVTRQNHRIARCKASNATDAAFVDAAYGAFPDAGALAKLSDGYQEAFNPKLIKANASNWEKALREGYRFPLSMGRHGLERSGRGGGLGGPTLFVVDPSSTLDLIDLWNIRLFQPNVLAVNAGWFVESASYMAELITANHRPLPGNPHGVMVSTTIEFGRSIGEARAKALLDEAALAKLPKGSWAFKLWYSRIWEEKQSELMESPSRARITAKTESLDLAIAENERERSVRFRSLSPEFSSEFQSSSAAWVNVLQFRAYGAHSDLALSLPADFEPAQTYRLRGGGVILPTREGWVLPQQYRDHTEFFNLRTGREAMTAWLQQHGLKADISKAGRNSEQVLASVNGIHGVRLLAHRETVELLDKMAKSVRKYPDGTVEEYQDRTAAATTWSALMAKRVKELWFHKLSLDEFVQRGVLKLGLGIQCSHCSNVNWYGVSELSESIVCDRCRKSFPFPQGSIPFTKSPWKYRVVGPFSVPDYADGAYATVLTLRVFAHSLSSMHTSIVYTPGLDLTVDGAPPIEVDFALWYSRENFGLDESETVTVFGESKSFGLKCFHSEDVARMRQIAEKFPGAFLVFSAMKTELHEDERIAITGLAAWGRERMEGGGRPRAPVIVLTGTELFAPWRVRETWKKLGGLHQEIAEANHVRLENLWELADATQQIYLGMKSRADEEMEKWEAMRKAAEASASASKGSKVAGTRRTAPAAKNNIAIDRKPPAASGQPKKSAPKASRKDRL